MSPSTQPLGRGRTVLVLSDHFPPATLGGGPARSLGAMVRRSRHPGQVHVVTRDTDHTARAPMAVPRDRWTEFEGTNVWYASVVPAWKIMPAMLRAREICADDLYLNSVFSWRFGILPLILRRLGFWRGARIVVAPRGELDPGALAIKATKKRRYLDLARRAGLFSQVVWHTSSPLEANNVYDAIRTDDLVVKENETDLPATANSKTRRPDGTIRLVCPGRVSPKKRIELLIEALADPRTSTRFHLTIAGGEDDPEYHERLRRSATTIQDRVRWTGPLSRDELFAVIDDSDVACFPTAGENFGHAIVESLSRSKPVLVADVTPWTQTVAQGGGIVVGTPTSEGWVAALAEIEREDDLAARRSLAGTAYESWRSRTNPTSFLDFLVEDRLHELAWAR